MLVLLSFGLVLVATILLVLGLLSDEGLMLIWLSIASSVAAALVLVVALKLNKPRDEVRSVAPEPLPVPEPQPALATAPAGGMATAVAPAPESDEWLAADQDTWSADDWSGAGEVEFPIADYDTLTAGQILPLLPQLYEDEIPVVEERERSTKARPEILQKLGELRGTGEAARPADDGAPAALEPVEPTEALPAVTDATAPVPAVDPLASYTEPATSSWDDDWFPIEDYESLSAAQIRPLLPELDAEELVMVRDKELELGRRRSLLDEIERLMPGSESATPTSAGLEAPPVAQPLPPVQPSAPAAKRPGSSARKAPAKKAPAKKAPAKRAPADKAVGKKAAPAKKASPAKKAAPVKKAATKAPAKKAAPVKKAATKKATAKAIAKQPAKKASASKKAAPAKKAGPTKKAGGR